MIEGMNQKKGITIKSILASIKQFKITIRGR